MEAALGPYQVGIATDFGPRVTSLRRGDGPEVLASLGPDVSLTHQGGVYRFRGGHRLWASPEVPAVTYATDDHRCEVSAETDLVRVSAPPDSAGLVKEITIRVDDESLVVDHRLGAAGDPAPRSAAAWAITQLPLGGHLILPLVGADTSPAANRYLVMWPYSSIEDRRVTLDDDVLEVEAAAGPPIKFGVGPAPGRLGYFRDGIAFVKEVEAAAGRDVPDFGAVGQAYVGQGFCELESLGGLTDLSEAGVAESRERWTVQDCADLEAAVRLTVGS